MIMAATLFPVYCKACGSRVAATTDSTAAWLFDCYCNSCLKLLQEHLSLCVDEETYRASLDNPAWKQIKDHISTMLSVYNISQDAMLQAEDDNISLDTEMKSGYNKEEPTGESIEDEQRTQSN